MKIKILFVFLLIAGVCNAQEVVDKKKAGNEVHDYPESKLIVSKVDRLLGATKLVAQSKIITDSTFVKYLANNPGYSINEQVEDGKIYYNHRWSSDGLSVITRRTGFDVSTLDDFVEEINIWNRKGRKLPFSGHVDMTHKEYKKQLLKHGFKYLKCEKSPYSKTFKGYIFERSNASVQIYYDYGQFNRMKIKANFDYIFGGKLIK